MAYRHDEITEAGARVVGISVDSPQQHAAMVDKLRLPFPLLSDPDREAAIRPYGVADEEDPRNIARPAVVIVGPDQSEAYRVVSRDFADRLIEDEILRVLSSMDLEATTQEPPELGAIEAGPQAMPFEHLYPYMRGARFAAVALSRRHPEIEGDAEEYIAQMDRYMDYVKRLFKEKRDAAGS